MLGFIYDEFEELFGLSMIDESDKEFGILGVF
jgi:hypothetical protein